MKQKFGICGGKIALVNTVPVQWSTRKQPVAKLDSHVLNLVRDFPKVVRKKATLEVSCQMKWNNWYIHEGNIETVSYIWSSACNRTVECYRRSNVCLLTVLHPSVQKNKSWPQWYRLRFYLILGTSP